MSLDKMRELLSRYKIPFNYVCKISGDDEYISTPGPLEVAVFEETF